MGSVPAPKPHAVVVPFPAQGHITPLLKLAKILHSHAFYITFVNTHFSQSRLLRSAAADAATTAAADLPDFRFETIPDGLPPPESADAGQYIPHLMDSIPKNFPSPFLDLLTNLNAQSTSSEGVPPITCIICDGLMTFALDAADRLAVPGVVFWTASSCGLMAYLHFPDLVHRGLAPLKGEDVADELLDTPIDWIPGMRNVRLRDMPSFHRPTDTGDIVFNYLSNEAQRAASRARAIIVNTFDEFESPVLQAMAALVPPIYPIGPINLLETRFPFKGLFEQLGSNLWKEDEGCLAWLDGRKPSSVLYVNFGSIIMVSNAQLAEFAWGLANSGCDFLWVIRRDLVVGERAILPPGFLEVTEGRRLMASWCAQEEVLAHPAVGGFLTHSGWNSMLENISSGLPVICWPFLAEQMTNCRYACGEWGIGMEIGNDVRREEVAALVREVMGGKKGKEMRKRAGEWKERAERATAHGGSSVVNLEKLVNDVLLRRRTLRNNATHTR